MIQNNCSDSDDRRIYILLFILSVIISIPIFFDVYRGLAFNSMPTDPYDLYLKAIVEGKILDFPGAPFVYRIFSILFSYPSYYILPDYQFSQLSAVNATLVKAQMSIAFTSVLCLIFTPLVLFKYLRTEYGVEKSISFFSSILIIPLSGYISLSGVDSIAILLISILILNYNKVFVFIPLLLFCIFVNEKILLVIFMLTFVRSFSCYRKEKKVIKLKQFVTSICSIVIYLIVIKFYGAAGSENQLDIATYIDGLYKTLSLTFTAKGLILNFLPILIIAWAVYYSYMSRKKYRFYSNEFFVFIGMTIIVLVMNVSFNVGRLVMYVYPIYIIGIAYFLETTFKVTSNKKISDYH